MNTAQLDRFDQFFDDRHRLITLARRQRAVAGVVLGARALAVVGAELLVAHR